MESPIPSLLVQLRKSPRVSTDIVVSTKKGLEEIFIVVVFTHLLLHFPGLIFTFTMLIRPFIKLKKENPVRF